MSSKYPLSADRHVARSWAEHLIKSLGDRIVTATEQMLQRASDQGGTLIPVPVRVVGRRRTDRSQRQ
jgi:hypothetical protein